MPARVLVLGGPTATGKSDLAVELAERFGARIASADAMTVYRGLDVGTAKPPPEVLARHPHACVDVREVDEDFTVDDFVREVEALAARAERVVVAGGTPFYLRALVRPLSPLPPPDPAVRARLEALDDPHALLRERDPVTAARLHPNDRVRVVRALEVLEVSGRPMSAWQAMPPRRPPLADAVAWIDRDDLRERIEARLRWMAAHGYVEETRAVLAAGHPPGLKPLRSFAYRHLVAHVQGGIALDEALRRTGRDTWRLARKQRTWARGLGWSAVDPAAVVEIARRLWEG